MNELTVAPFGSWLSPYAIERLIDGVVFISEVRRAGGTCWWLEGRPDEDGRQVLVRRDPDGSLIRLTPAGFNARCRVHEYGGAATLVSGDLVIVSDFMTGRLHRVVEPEVLVPLTPDRQWRFADLDHDAPRGRVYAIREDHEPDVVAAHGEWVNELVAIDLATGAVSVIAAGADFYAAPRLSPDGRHLVWLEWRHPNLPWDGTVLRMASIAADGSIGTAETVAGSASDWISQPRWSPAGVLHFVAEPDGWMNLQRVVDGRLEPIAAMEVEFASPEWVFGNAEYGFLPDGAILAIGRSGGRDRLYRVGPDGSSTTLDLPYTEIGSVSIDGSVAVMRVVSPTEPARVIAFDTATGDVDVLRVASPLQPDPADVSIPRHIEFPSTGGRISRGNYYAPHNARFRAPDGELPPLVVTSHGGPTSAAFSGWTTTMQLFASRGFAVLDVDYGGSTGYGREYRRSLNGEWGIVDVDDCVAGAEWLVAQGLADPARLAIRGGSASGFTTLAALAFRRTFTAGTTLFGIGDLRSFVKDTHKFESRYLETMVGPWPETRQRYLDRSPALHADRIVAPVLVQQGADDRVVPPAEAERIVAALREQRVPHAFILFPGEDHGFRGREAIIRSVGAELSFYGQIFGFTPADAIEPLAVTFIDEDRASGA
ncbi:MAG: S9 family peptidase [Chloroflexi bacterium]|nr:S9 family peptidase [Chloroflexota bacterium]